MAFIIIFTIAGLIFGIVDGIWLSDKILQGIVCSLLGFVVGLLTLITIGSLIGFLLPKKEVVTEKQIYALNDVTSISGYRYLARGYIEEEEVIKYISDGEYGKKIFTADADNSYINECYDNAYVEIRDKQLKYDWFYLFSMEWYDNVYIFYIPDGSVTNEINIDLK